LNAGNGGIGIILRGGDTWHEGNSSAAPYSGGQWDLYQWFSNAYTESNPNCLYEGTQTGCLYVGVDTTWYNSSTCGSSWCRPVLTGDNPTVPGYGNFAASCGYQISGSDFGTNNLVIVPTFGIIDSLELTGVCSSTSGGNGGYFAGMANSGSSTGVSILLNVYMHGWSATSTSGQGSGSHPVTVISGGGVQQVFDHIVIDGSDSNPEVAAWGTFPVFYHVRDSIIRYIGQGVGQQCHDIHDNIFEHFYYTELDGHINILECNSDADTSTANVFYNNVMRHNDPSIGNAEGWWFCPNSTPEYWFNNLIYDAFPPGAGQPWAYAGPPIYSGCTNTGGQYMFNNTLVDAGLPCYVSTDSTNGQYITAYNNLIIGASWSTGSPECAGGPNSTTNVTLTDAQATSQGYTTGSSGTVGSGNTCANDSTQPCKPTAASNSTVGAGSNLQSYCTALTGYTSEYAIGTEAANACTYGTTDGCGYVTNGTGYNNYMSCPAHTAAARPGSKAWDSGVYQYLAGPPSPTNLQGQANPVGQ
jgi:hypothetical protein